jgi:oligopeptide transport system substrate-binding protein
LKWVEIKIGHIKDFGKLEAYEAGEFDVINAWKVLDELDQVWGRYSREFVAGPLENTFCLVFDITRPPFNDLRVRKALSLAINKSEVWARLRIGAADTSIPATGGFVPPGTPGHSPGISLAFNPDEAKKLLAEAGYPEGKDFPQIEILCVYENDEESRRIERTFSSRWKEILGIESQWEFIIWESFLKRMQTTQPMMFSLVWVADYPDPDNFLRLGLPKGTGWKNDDYDALIERSMRSLDQTERLTLLKEADKILVEEAPIIPLGYYGNNYLVKPWVRRFSRSWKYVIIDPH